MKYLYQSKLKQRSHIKAFRKKKSIENTQYLIQKAVRNKPPWVSLSPMQFFIMLNIKTKATNL